MNLKIGSHNYKVKFVEIPADIEAENMARTNKTSATITIDKKVIPTEKFATLLHEILHIINGEIPEKEVEALAQQLTQVLIDNKWLSKRILKACG